MSWQSSNPPVIASARIAIIKADRVQIPISMLKHYSVQLAKQVIEISLRLFSCTFSKTLM